MRPIIDNTFRRTNPLTVGMTAVSNKRYELNTSRADGLAFFILPPQIEHHANVVLTAAARVFTLPVATATALEDMLDRAIMGLHVSNMPNPIMLVETVSTETVKKSNTFLLNEREKEGRAPAELVLTTQVTRRMLMRNPTTFGAPPGFMTVSYEVLHKDDPFHQVAHSFDASRTHLLKLFTTMQDDNYG